MTNPHVKIINITKPKEQPISSIFKVVSQQIGSCLSEEWVVVETSSQSGVYKSTIKEAVIFKEGMRKNYK